MSGSTKLKDGLLTGKLFRSKIISFFAAEIMTVLGSVIDGFVVGNTMDADSIAAAGFVSPAVILFAVIGTTAGISFQVRSLQCLSRGDVDGAGRALTETLMLGMGLSAVFMTLTMIHTGSIVAFIGVSEESASFPMCLEYLKGVAAGLPAMTAMAILTRGAQIDGSPKVSVWAVAVMAVSNILGDFTVTHFTDAAMLEIGLVTSLSYYAGAAVLVWYYTKPDILLKPVVKGISLKETAKVNNLGMWGGLIAVVSGITLFLRAKILNVAVDLFEAGSAGLQAYNVQVQINYLVSVFQNSAVSTMFLLAALCTAEEDRVSFKKLISRIVEYDILSALSVSIMLFCFAGGISRLYLGDSDSEALVCAAGVLKAFSIGLTFQMMVLLFANYIQLFGRNILAIFIIIISNVLVPLFGAGFGGEAAKTFSSEPVAGIFKWISALYMFTVILLPLFVLIVNRRTGGKDFWWMIPEDYGTAPENELRAVITTKQEIMEFADRAWEFCRAKGESQRICYLTALAIEETATNVVDHGFSKDEKAHILSIRLVYKPDELILRFRDDCRGFDPRKRYETVFGKEEPGEMIGIRVIMAEAKEVRYTSMFRLNNLIIRIDTGSQQDRSAVYQN